VFATMAHVPVAHFCRAWLEQGEAVRRSSPAYDGNIAQPSISERYFFGSHR
jgi:hypothetical protein